MELRADSKLVKWAYFFGRKRQINWRVSRTDQWGTYDGYEYTDVRYPKSTTLCRFFWRAFVFMPIFWLVVGGGASILLWKLLLLILANLPMFLSIVLCAALTMASIFLAHRFGPDYILRPAGEAAEKAFDATRDRVNRTVDRIEESVFWQGLMALKSKICPIITIKS